MYINFKELPMSGFALEFLVEEILRLEGLDVHWEGAGNDNGKDLIVTEEIGGMLGRYKHKWVVQCKHTAHSGKALGTTENLNIVDTCHMVNADGYLLVCTTHLSSRLIEKLDSIEANYKIKTKYWDAVEIENRLLKPSCFSLIERYFPQSSHKIGIKIYNSVHPSNWLATYNSHLFSLSSRISNLFPPVDMVERLIDIVDDFYKQYNRERYVLVKVEMDGETFIGIQEYPIGAEALPVDENDEREDGFIELADYEYIRVRSIWHDDKNNNYHIKLDYLFDSEVPLIDLEHFKSYFRNVDIVNGCGVIWDFGLYKEYFAGDHFNPNHAKYYKDPGDLSFRRGAVSSHRIDFNIYDDNVRNFADLLK